MKKLQIILMAVLLAAGAGYSALLTVDFAGQTVGQQPTGAYRVDPLAGNTNVLLSTKVVNDSMINKGTGNALNVYDNTADTNGVAGVQYNFVSGTNTQESAVGVKFQYTQRSTQTAIGAGNLVVSLGEYGSGKTGMAEVQFGALGKVRSVFGGSTSNMVNDQAFATGTVHTVEFFANDFDSSTVNYTQNGTNYSLNANSYTIWIDGVNYGGTAGNFMNIIMGVDGGTNGGPTTVANTEWNFGKVAILSNGAQGGDDYDFGNIVVTALIPEPATMGMLLLGAVTVLAIRRRRA